MAGEAPAKPAAAKAPPVKVFDCPSCGAGVMLRAQGYTVSAVCRACGSVIDTTNENYQVISRAARKLRIDPLIPLGQRGRLHGVLWEVIGYMQRTDGSGAYRWNEYLLFNPMRGFRWLTEFDGHWNYVTPIKEKPSAHATLGFLGDRRSAVRYLGRTFHLFHKGSAQVAYVVGEFYWRVKVSERVSVQDYICPPEILSREATPDEITWSVGEYVEPQVIKAAFQVTKRMPARTGVAPNQPSTASPATPAIVKHWRRFLAVAVLVQSLVWFHAHNEEVYSGHFTWRLDDPLNMAVTPQFELRHGVSNVAFRLRSPVNNSWLEVAIDLVNDQTGATYTLEQGVEYYSGYDRDGYWWSEGSGESEKILSSVPAGLYHLNIQATGPATTAWSSRTLTEQTYSLAVVRDVTTWSNFFLALAFLSAVPIVFWWRSHSFEQARWSTSDFSPYWLKLTED